MRKLRKSKFYWKQTVLCRRNVMKISREKKEKKDKKYNNKVNNKKLRLFLYYIRKKSINPKYFRIVLFLLGIAINCFLFFSRG